jgi:hypothetical protein
MSRRILLRIVLVMTIFGLTASPMTGQVVSGTITGFVTDPSGAAVPGATVSAINVQTGVVTKRTTESTGLYSITNLIPGTYSVTVEATGFQKAVHPDVVLNVDSKVTIDFQMTVGAVTQEVTVTAAAPLLKAEKADVSQVISERSIQELPVLGRNVSQLEFLSPGTIPYTFQQGPGENPSLGATATANGQFWGSNEFQIDGITDVEFGSTGMQIIVPPQDSVQEMKVTTSNYDAELGQVSGLVSEYVTKSGTNDFHGSLFWFNRNKATFAANPFSEKVAGTGPEGKGTGPAPFNWNQAGGSAGGPIKKNKMFIFGDYQLTRTRQGSSSLTTVPTNAFQNGDLSAALGNYICADGSTSVSPCANPVMVPTTEGGTVAARQNMIFDPTTGNPDGSGRSAFTVGGQPNVIPADRISPVSANLLAFLRTGLGNRFVDQSKIQNNFAGTTRLLFNQDQFDVRYDWNISDKNKFFARYTYFKAKLDNPPLFGLAGGPAGGGLNGETANYRDQLGALNFTRSLSPTLLTEARFGIVRFGLKGYQWDVGHKSNDQVGIQGINSDDPLTQGLAGINIAGPVGNWFMGLPSGAGIPRIQFNTIFQWVNNWTWMHSNHQLRWGVDARRQRFDFLTVNESSRGNYTFGQNITQDATVPGSTGLGMATFLLGLPSHFDRGSFSQFPAERDTRFAWYFQDDWHLTQKLTVNLGIRYEYIGPSTPHFAGGGVNYDPATGNLLLSGVGQVSRTANIRSDWNNFGPRVGFAYRVLSKTVVRGGFGRSYFSSNYGGGVFGTLCCSYPVQTRQGIDQVATYFPIQDPVTGDMITLSTVAPSVPQPVIPSSGLLPLPKGLGAFHVPFDNPTSYVDSWNFSVQHQLRSDFSLTMAYVGNASRKLFGAWNLNAAIPGPGDVASRRPYHAMGIDTNISDRCHCINASYNALQITADKRFGGGYSILSSYTWSKAMDREFGGFGWSSQNQNPHDINASYGINENNRASVWTLAHVWHLPYGNGQRWGSTAPGWQKALLGGWTFNGITTLMSGFPIGINWSDNSSLNVGGDFGQRPDVVGSPAKNIPPGLWYNPAAFRNPGLRGPYLFGNYGRDPGDLRGPGWMTADWAFWKEFSFKTPLSPENTVLQFRWENFNFFNNTNRDLPVNDALNPQAGMVFGLAPAAAMRRMQFGLRLQW